jgi:hypothetical protein
MAFTQTKKSTFKRTYAMRSSRTGIEIGIFNFQAIPKMEFEQRIPLNGITNMMVDWSLYGSLYKLARLDTSSLWPRYAL